MLHFLIYDVLGTPAILVGLFSLIGLLLQKKGISDVISGTLKTIMGFVILTAGAGIIAYTLTIFSQLFEHSFHIQGVVPNTDAMAALAQKNYGTETATIMVLGMLINIALARLTPLKYIFLTGHHTLYMAAMLAVILSVGGLSGGWVVAIGAVILGAMMVISPAILQPFTRKITNTDDLALGHFGSIGYLLSALVGKIIGKGSPSIEEIKVPKSLNFLRDSSVAISLTMMILFLVLVLVAGKSFVTAGRSTSVETVTLSPSSVVKRSRIVACCKLGALRISTSKRVRSGTELILSPPSMRPTLRVGCFISGCGAPGEKC